ncbi:hypothetical protein B0J14DRAFT_568894 [Halenospora varia]|nr:hypothetical protein B0J14DRAFT_568894 [Halenospora varia]
MARHVRRGTTLEGSRVTLNHCFCLQRRYTAKSLRNTIIVPASITGVGVLPSLLTKLRHRGRGSLLYSFLNIKLAQLAERHTCRDERNELPFHVTPSLVGDSLQPCRDSRDELFATSSLKPTPPYSNPARLENANMYRSLRAAQKAAIEGEGAQEIDTQACMELQKAIFSSSPARPPQNAPTTNASPPTQSELYPTIISQSLTTGLKSKEAPSAERLLGNGIAATTAATTIQPNPLVNGPSDQAEIHNAGPKVSIDSIRIRGGIRQMSFLSRPDAVEGKVLQATIIRKPPPKMDTDALDDLTQKSSMSLTQKNSDSAYEQFNITRVPRDHYLLASQDDGHIVEGHETIWKQQYSARTDSTAHTYKENESNHIALNYRPENDADMEEEDAESQDDSYAQLPEHIQQPSLEPQTPAPPINPFKNRGSVLKGADMFGATQPSSIGRHVFSPTSSRPSPDVYNDFSSPPPPARRNFSSPLTRGRHNNAYVDDQQDTPKQSSVQSLLARVANTQTPQATMSRLSGVQSFDTGPALRPSSSIPEPRKYNSMKESQERRRKESESSTLDSDSDLESGSDIDDGTRRNSNKRKREEEIRRQLSAVPSLQAPAVTMSSPALVEVPSTANRRRRRSTEEDYLAQREGIDARDAQQEDIITDSQALIPTRPGTPIETDSGTPHTASVTNLLGVSQATTQDLPLQEVSANRPAFRTPHASKELSSSRDDVDRDEDQNVPETSPPEARMRTMGEIGLSFSAANGEDDDFIQNPPGFTQDEDFHLALKDGMVEKPITSTYSTIVNSNEVPEIPNSAAIALKNEIAIVPQDSAVRDSPKASQPPDLEQQPAGQVKGATSLTNAVSTVPLANQAFGEIIDGQELNLKSPLLTIQNAGDIEMVNSIPILEEHLAMAIEPSNPQIPADTELVGPARSRIEFVKPKSPPLSSSKRPGLRSKAERKSTPKAARPGTTTPSQAGSRASVTRSTTTRSSKRSSTENSPASTPLSSPPASMPEPSKQISEVRDEETPVPIATKRVTKRPSRLSSTKAKEPSRASKRQSIPRAAKEDSIDPLSLSVTSTPRATRNTSGIFAHMAFAVSYVKQEKDKEAVVRNVEDFGGTILQDGFDSLFKPSKTSNRASDDELVLTSAAKSLGFVALISDEHSRKTKYMQALALGLPCISGHWVLACVQRGMILDWRPYLLCAGQSSVLGNAYMSRDLTTYSASKARFREIFTERKKLLSDKSILVVGKDRADAKRETFMFLTRALGPARLKQVADYNEARKKLVEAETEGEVWDLLYVDSNEKAAESAVFGPAKAKSGSKKRKRGAPPDSGAVTVPPKRVRLLSDEDVVQSLIFGQLIDERLGTSERVG